MKKLISLCLAVIMIFGILPVSAFAAEATAPTGEFGTYESAARNSQMRLSIKKTLALGNTWTDVKVESNLLDANLTVTNHTTSVYAVKVRIISKDYTTIIKDAKTINAGHSASFSKIPSGGYIIQARSGDDVEREYTLSCKD